MKKLFYVLVLCYLFLPDSLYALNKVSQNKDSLLTALEKAGEDTNKVNILMELAFLEKNYLEAPDLSLNYAWKALELEKRFGFKIRLGTIYRKIGNIYADRINNYEKALEYYLKSLKLYQQSNYKVGAAACFNNIGNIYSSKAELSGDDSAFTIALENHFHALKLYEELARKGRIAQSCMSIADAYLAHSDYIKALEYYRKCNDLILSCDSADLLTIRKSFVGLSEAYAGMNETKKALENILQYKKYLDATNNQYDLMFVYIFLGESYLKDKEYQLSLENLQKALTVLQKYNVLECKQKTYFLLSQLFRETKEYQKAFDYFTSYVNLKDSLSNAKLKRDMRLMPILKESEKKENEIEQQDLLLNRKNIQLIALIAILLLIVVSSIFFYYRYIIKQKEKFNAELLKQQQLSYGNALEAEEKERIRIARDLHDGIGQLLSAIKLNVYALKQKLSHQQEDQSPLFINISQLVDETIKDVRTISHNLAPSALEKSKLDEALIRFTEIVNAGEKLSIQLQIIDLPEGLNNSFAAMLYRVIQEAVNNTIKYAQATHVTLQLIRHEEELTLVIEDDGIGFDSSTLNQQSGMGLKNIYSRINYWKGKVNIDSQPGKGTTIIIEVPIVKNKNHEKTSSN